MMYPGIECCLFHCHIIQWWLMLGYLPLTDQFTVGHTLCIISAFLYFQLLGHRLDLILNVLFSLLFKTFFNLNFCLTNYLLHMKPFV